MILNVNSDANVVFANKLEKLSRTALPNVVRKSLNGAAMDVKKRTLLKSANKSFTLRSKTFFKAKSRVNFAEGKDINKMKSAVGMIDSGLYGGQSYAVKNLIDQEQGGTIKGRKFIAVDAARVSKNRSKNVKKNNRIGGGIKFADWRNSRGKNRNQKWFNSAKKAGVGGLIRGSFSPIIFRIASIKKRKSGTKIKVNPVYYIRPKSSFRVKSTGFAKRAAMESHKLVDTIFMKEAKIRFKRQLK